MGGQFESSVSVERGYVRRGLVVVVVVSDMGAILLLPFLLGFELVSSATCAAVEEDCDACASLLDCEVWALVLVLLDSAVGTWAAGCDARVALVGFIVGLAGSGFDCFVDLGGFVGVSMTDGVLDASAAVGLAWFASGAGAGA